MQREREKKRKDDMWEKEEGKSVDEREGQKREGYIESSCHFAANRREAEAKVTDCKVAAVQTDDLFSWD